MNLIEYFNKFVRIITFLTPVTDCCMSFPSISGSCFFLKFNNEFIVITAGHVFKDFSVENLKILLNPFAKNTNDSHRLLSLAGGFNFFNGSRFDVNYDADAYDFCILNVAKEELEEDLNSFFWEYSPPQNSYFSLDNDVIVAGYPTIEQEIDFDSSLGIFSMVSLSAKISNVDNTMLHFCLKTMPNALKSFDGFSGAPVFYKTRDNVWQILGWVIRGSSTSGILHCINIRMIEAAMKSYKECIADGRKPDYIGEFYNDGSL